MSRKDGFKLTQKFVTLLILVSALFFLSTSLPENKIFGMVCCSDCVTGLADCKAGCPGPGEPGRTFCLRDCNQAFQPCFAECTSNCQ